MHKWNTMFDSIALFFSSYGTIFILVLFQWNWGCMKHIFLLKPNLKNRSFCFVIKSPKQILFLLRFFIFTLFWWFMKFICLFIFQNVYFQYCVIPTRRSAAESVQILLSHALGDAGSPYLIGVVSIIYIKMFIYR